MPDRHIKDLVDEFIIYSVWEEDKKVFTFTARKMYPGPKLSQDDMITGGIRFWQCEVDETEQKFMNMSAAEVGLYHMAAELYRTQEIAGKNAFKEFEPDTFAGEPDYVARSAGRHRKPGLWSRIYAWWLYGEEEK